MMGDFLWATALVALLVTMLGSAAWLTVYVQAWLGLLPLALVWLTLLVLHLGRRGER